MPPYQPWQKIDSVHGDDLFQGLGSLTAGRLQRLGFTSRQQINAFLDPQKYIPSPPEALPGMALMVDRLVDAIHLREPIWVWGDFDVDGQTATAILVSTLLELGAVTRFHIPVRNLESHGLNISWLQKIHDLSGNLILTCDTGISNHEAIHFANSLGMQVLVSDHHALPGSLPDAFAIVNPRLLEAGHPLEGLSGAGVAYKISEALYDRFGSPQAANKNLDLVALGQVADLAELLWDSRFLVQSGLNALRSTNRLGLKTLFETARLDSSHVNEEHIGFWVAPRFNALGRLGDANQAVELLTTNDPVKAGVIVHTMEGMNAQRQLLTRQVLGAAEAQIHENPQILEKPLIFLTHTQWHAGVIGIVASHLTERYHKPVIMVTAPANNLAHGSARSVEGINIIEIITKQASILTNFGGHPMAAGFSLEYEKLAEFQKGIQRSVLELPQDTIGKSQLVIDGYFSFSKLDHELADQIEILAPFGPGNPKPVLASRNVQVIKTSSIGKQKEHLKLVAQDLNGDMQSILWWNAGDPELLDGTLDMAYTLRNSDWQGSAQLQIELVDFQPSAGQIESTRSKKLVIQDERTNSDPVSFLTSLPDGSFVWAEGPDEKFLVKELKNASQNLVFINRNHPTTSKVLAIWTPPASGTVLRQVLKQIKPLQVIVLSGNSNIDEPGTFKLRMAGLLKYAIQHDQGQFNLDRFAVAMALPESTVSIGLGWFEFEGWISITRQEDDKFTVTRSDKSRDPELARVFLEDLKTRLEETCAFRRHWLNAEINHLIQTAN